MIPIEDVLNRAFTMDGKKYIYGYEIRPNEDNPRAADCSELVEWSCFKEGVRPFMPDGAVWQYRHCVNHDTEMEVGDALYTKGALLFRFSSNPLKTRPKHAHVAFSLGTGSDTFEARGKAYGVGFFGDADERPWTHAARIPGAEY